MLNKQKQLLCTFTNNVNYSTLFSEISSFYNVLENKIFVFTNIKNYTEYYLTYNVDCTNTKLDRFPHTISIHRKKMYNTLYTLNAMNKLIAEVNGGVFDKNFQLNWDLYKNSLILTNDYGVKIINLNLVTIVTL